MARSMHVKCGVLVLVCAFIAVQASSEAVEDKSALAEKAEWPVRVFVHGSRPPPKLPSLHSILQDIEHIDHPKKPTFAPTLFPVHQLPAAHHSFNPFGPSHLGGGGGGDDDDDDDDDTRRKHHQGGAGGFGGLSAAMGGAPPVSHDPLIQPAVNCKFTLKGEDYDLTPLSLVSEKAGQDFIAQDTKKDSYTIRVCGTTAARESFATNCARKQGMICQYRDGRTPFLLGVVARWGTSPLPDWQLIDPSDPATGVKLTANNGDTCFFGGHRKPRRASVFFVCDSSVEVGQQISAQETSTCNYVFTVSTKYACPGMAGLSHGWWFIILFTVFFSLYCLAGCCYKRFKLEVKGVEATPNIEFWRELPNLVRDGCRYTFNCLSCYAVMAKDRYNGRRGSETLPEDY